MFCHHIICHTHVHAYDQQRQRTQQAPVPPFRILEDGDTIYVYFRHHSHRKQKKLLYSDCVERFECCETQLCAIERPSAGQQVSRSALTSRSCSSRNPRSSLVLCSPCNTTERGSSINSGGRASCSTPMLLEVDVPANTAACMCGVCADARTRVHVSGRGQGQDHV